MPVATADLHLPKEDTTLYYYLEVKDGGIIDTYPGTAFEKRRKHVPHAVTIEDMRPIKDQFSLHKNGFELCHAPTQEKDFTDEQHVERVFYPECEALFKKISGCDEVHFISHMTRRHRFDEAQSDAAAKGDQEFVTKNNPARFVHCDQSYRGAEQLLYLNLSEDEADRRIQKRWAVMNIWQPIINDVKRDPLAFCDFQSVDENDFRTVIANLPPPEAGEYGKVSKNLKNQKQRYEYSLNGEKAPRYEVTNMAHNPTQKWYYASDMTPEEAWVFKIYDSKQDVARCAVHSSFPLSTQTDSGPPRQSVEVRAFLFWNDE